MERHKENKEVIKQKSSDIFQSQSQVEFIDKRPESKNQVQLQKIAKEKVTIPPFIQKKINKTGLPDNLKTGIEEISGYSMDDVKVHYNSSKPSQLQAHAFAQGTDIHIANGQEKHLPHEAWHVVQQKQGRVKPTLQMKGNLNVNDDTSLEREADVMGGKALQLKKENNTKEVNNSFSQNNSRIIQKKGVKSELISANAKLDDLIQESTTTKGILTHVTDSIYDYYKPKLQGTLPLSHTASSQGRDKTNAQLRMAIVKERAERLNGWADTANQAASRIFEELKGVSRIAGIDLSTITMGKDTKLEADASAHTHAGKRIILESKLVNSPAQGQVDFHVIAASSQIEKRRIHYGPNNEFIANINVQNNLNPWPYTPKEFQKSAANNFNDFNNILVARLAKYKAKANSVGPINFNIYISNPNLSSYIGHNPFSIIIN